VGGAKLIKICCQSTCNGVAPFWKKLKKRKSLFLNRTLQPLVSNILLSTFFYSCLVFDDLGEITRRHFKDLQTLVRQRRAQEFEQAPPQYPAQYSTQQQGNQYYSTQTPKQQSNYYQTGPVQQHPPSSAYAGQHQSGCIY